MPELPPSSQTLSDHYLAPAWYLTAPLAVTHEQGAYLFTEDGRRHLDFACGYAVTSTGHGHPQVVQASQEQAARLIHISTVAANPVMLQFAEQLATITPQGLDMMFFHSSAIIAFRGAFHGRTTGALALTSSKALYRRGHGPFMPGVYIAPYATPFGCPTGGRRDGCAEACLQQLDTLFAHEVDPSQVAAMFVEPILGEGGYIDPPPAFLQRLRRRWRLCR